MEFVHSIHAVDAHTMGEPTRIVVAGFPRIRGATMPARRAYLQEHLDHWRTAIMLEPRGHRDMFGAVLTEPCSPEADFGIIFMDGGGYLNMCGHGSIGAMTVVAATGMVPLAEPVTRVTLEAPAGLVHGEVAVEQGRVREVSLLNVPSFLYRSGVAVEIPELGTVKVDIAFGGNFFILVPADELGLELLPANVQRLMALGVRIREVVNRTVPIRHPTLPHIRTADLVEFYGKAGGPGAHARNVVVFGSDAAPNVDRSPCGTGTSAKLAALHHHGRLKPGEDFVYESILGTRFRGRIMDTLRVGEYPAVMPRITGSAYITGFNHFVIDERDPLKFGFAL